ncbi:hypothetical protein DV515_00007270 [Chloebia gouldiae]|uniref:Uncharacterized protein n=1 Tax=Chloebia gouldiae TaxID=44316 RepID=A0A3L8SI83_CHLGU|nr:hypothetical protein DV515_00007270 [Chloebia gouldiae]
MNVACLLLQTLQCTQSWPDPGRIPTCWTQYECPTSGKSDWCDSAADSELRHKLEGFLPFAGLVLGDGIIESSGHLVAYVFAKLSLLGLVFSMASVGPQLSSRKIP